MPDYFVFGGCLRSELSFPELAETRGRAPNWTLRLGTLSQPRNAEVLSDVELSSTCRIRLTTGDGWFRYDHSCTGAFEVFAEGRRILFEPSAKGDLNGARADFVSRVLLYCVDHTAITWLHGSAVRIGGSAVAFLGPSGAGKSTLALALAQGGAEHICDDTLPVDTTATPVVWPSDGIIRLCSDSRSRLAASESAIRRESDGKFVMSRRAAGSTESPSTLGEPASLRCPLAAIYVLTPDERVGSEAAVTRTVMKPTSAVAALMPHLKLGPVVRREDPARLVKQLGAIANAVPVFQLRVSRDWSAVDNVVETMLAWHTAGTAAARALVPA
jgi:hypothetical protein